MIIGSAAYFKVCARCQKHGRLYTADGVGSKVMFSKETALVVLDEDVKAGLITPYEVPEAKRQIMASPLPRYQADIGPIAELMSGIIDACESAFKVDDESRDNSSSHETIH